MKKDEIIIGAVPAGTRFIPRQQEGVFIFPDGTVKTVTGFRFVEIEVEPYQVETEIISVPKSDMFKRMRREEGIGGVLSKIVFKEREQE